MTHLGERITALVDGELDHDARDRALAHLARCASCRASADEQRWVKSRVRTLGAVEPSAALLSSLFQIAGPGDIESLRREQAMAMSLPAASYLTGPAVTATTPAAEADDRRTTNRRRRAGLAMAGAGSVGAAVFGLAYALGGNVDEPGPSPVTPPVGQFSVEFAGTSDALPFSDPAVDAYSASLRGGRPGLGLPDSNR